MGALFCRCCRRGPKPVTGEGLEKEMEELLALREAVADRVQRHRSVSTYLWWAMVLHAVCCVLFLAAVPRYPFLFRMVSPAVLIGLASVPPVFMWGSRRLLESRVKGSSVKLGKLEDQRQRLLRAIKDDLPMRQSLPLLQKYDPTGNHKMILDSPAQQAKIQSLSQDKRRLLTAVDALLDTTQMPDEQRQRLRTVLLPFQEELRNFRAVAGPSADQWIVDKLTGTPAPARPGMPPLSAPPRRMVPGGGSGAGLGGGIAVDAVPRSVSRGSTGSYGSGSSSPPTLPAPSAPPTEAAAAASNDGATSPLPNNDSVKVVEAGDNTSEHGEDDAVGGDGGGGLGDDASPSKVRRRRRRLDMDSVADDE